MPDAPAAPRTNALGQPIGAPLPGWRPPARPPRGRLEGGLCALEPADPDRHAGGLHAANALDTEGRLWTYLGYGPFADLGAYRAWMERTCRGEDPLFLTILDRAPAGAGAAGAETPVGLGSYLRVDPPSGSIEVGHLCFSPRLQRRPAATEAMYLMMRQVFALGYRRYEWKCDALNAPSRRAAERLGFRFEGIFRQATVYKGRNRDTAWYSILDREWPALERAYRAWLAPENLDAAGGQRRRLGDLIAQSRDGA